MAARWVRNLGGPALASSRGTHHITMTIANLLKMLGFDENNDGDAAWAGVLLIDDAGGGGVGTGFEVDADNPRRIYDTQGRFTQAMQDNETVIVLYGGLLDAEQNHSMWRISTFIDAYNVEVEAVSWNPNGWTTDTQLGGRVISYNDALLTVGAWATYDAPARMGRFRVRLDYVSTSVCNVSVAPMYNPLIVTGAGVQGSPDIIDASAAPNCKVRVAGLIGRLNKHMVGVNVTIAGAANAADDGTFAITAVDPTTGEITYTNGAGVGDSDFTGTVTVAGIATFTTAIDIGNYYMRRHRLNVYADDDVIHVYWTCRQSNNGGIYPYNFLSIGRLLASAVGDSEPIFIFGDAQVTSTRWPWNTEMRMLGGDVGATPIQAYLTYWKRDIDVTDDNSFPNQFGRRLVNGTPTTPGKFILIEPWVILADTATIGGCVRGRFPKFRVGYTNMEIFRPMDREGLWVHDLWGHFYPMNGALDPLPMLTEWD